MKKNVIPNPWGLMELLNNEETDSLDFEIGKYLYEKRDEINQMTIEEIAEDGCFSQSSISRFFIKNGFKSFKNYKILNEKENIFDEIIANEYRNSSLNFRDMMMELEKKIIDSLKVLELLEENKILELSNDLINANRIVFAGYTLCINAFKTTQNVLLYKKLNVYAPNDYTSQKVFINKLSKNDILIYSSLSSDLYLNGFGNFAEELIAKTNAKKYLISVKIDDDSKKSFDKIITLGNKSENKNYVESFFRLYIFDVLLSNYILNTNKEIIY